MVSDNFSEVDYVRSSSVFLRFRRSLDALNIEEGRPIIDDVPGSAETSFRFSIKRHLNLGPTIGPVAGSDRILKVFFTCL